MTRIGLWGTFDVEHLGDMLFPLVLRAELGRRVPNLDLRTASPIGYVGLNRYGDAHPPAPLGTWSEERVAAFAHELDALVIGGGEIVHGDDGRLAPWYGLPPAMLHRRAPHRFFVEGLGAREVDVPTVWHAIGIAEEPSAELAHRWRAALAGRAVVTVRDEPSKAALVAAGVERGIEVVPDPAYLVPRALPSPALAARVDRMRGAGVYPEGDSLVVQGAANLVGDVDAIADAVGVIAAGHGLTPVLVETEPIHGDRAFAEACMARIPGARRLPPDAGTDDVIAAIAWAGGVVGSSRALAVLAAAYDRPAVLLGSRDRPGRIDVVRRLGVPSRIVEDVAELASAFERVREAGSVASRVDELAAELDRHLDAIAALVTHVEVRADDPPVVNGSTLAAERERYAIATRALGARMAAMQEAFATRERDLRAYHDAINRELTERDIRFTKLWRKVHEADRHYHYHKHRADEGVLRIEHLERENEFLRGERVRPWLRRRVRIFLWWLRPTPVGRGLVTARDRLRRSP